jgi:hypothetical protein
VIPAPRTSLVRIAAALVAWLLVVGDFLGFAHQAAEAHAVCAEHGELVHAEGTHGESISELREVRAEPELSRGPEAPHGDEHGADDHCRACAAAHDPVTVAVADRAPESIAEIERAPIAAPVAAEVPARAVYRAAPKTSPPVA